MPGLVSDEMLDAYAVVGTYDEIAAQLRRRYGRLATSLEFAVPPADAGEDGVVRGLVESLRKGEA
jgi:alkanesulfonate monooxygenase SsuD/methylene tetrahydromethanopterin reductase-like flavin-dependent oxidoreductase (luciferase family)